MNTLLRGLVLCCSMIAFSHAMERSTDLPKMIIKSILFGNKDGYVLVTCDNDKVYVLNLLHANFKARVLLNCPIHVKASAFNDSYTKVLTVSKNNSVYCWDLEQKSEAGIELPGHTTQVTSVALKKDATCALTVCEDGTIRLWDLTKNPVVAKTIECKIKNFQAHFGPQGTLVIEQKPEVEKQATK